MTADGGRDLRVDKMLVLSTSHISKEDNAVLERWVEDRRECPTYLMEYPEGWILWVPSDPDELASRQDLPPVLSPEFINLFHLAIKMDCQWLRLDSDGETIDQMDDLEVIAAGVHYPTFDW